MKELSGQRAWEYTFQKKLEDEIENLRDALEGGDNRDGVTTANIHYLSGKIKGLKWALDEMEDARKRFKLDDDAD